MRALQWASKKDSVEREKLRKEEIRRKQRNAELARQQRLRREAADRSYSQWLEKKDLESNRQSTYAGEREDSTYSRSTLSSCGASRHSHASVTKVNPQLTCSIKVNPKQAKRNISSIGKPDKMQPYTNYPPKSSLRHASVHCGLGKSKSEPSRSGRSSRATVRSAASVPAGVRYYSKLHQQQQGTKKEQKKKEDGKCDMVELLEKEDSRDKTKQEHQATHQEMSEDDRDDKGQNEEPELWDSQQEVVYDGDCEAEHDELPASLQVALSGVDIAVVHDGESGNKDISTATSGTTKGDPVVQDLEDEGDETELTNLPVDEEEADELDFSKLQVNDPTLISSTGCIVEGEEDDLFHDVGHTNSLNALSLPNTVTKDRTPAEVIQLLRSLGGLSKSYNRSYSFSHSFGLAQRSRFHRRLSLGAIPEGQIVTSYSDEDQSTSQIIDSDFLESLVLNLGGDHREEKKDVWRPGSHTKRPNNIADGVSSESESDDSDTLSRSSSNDSVVGQVAVVEDEVISDLVSISPAEELEILGQYDTSGPVIRPQSLKIVNLAWNPCLNAVQSHITEAPLSVPDHPNRSGGCTPTHRTPPPSPHRESTEQLSSPSTSDSHSYPPGSNCSPSPIMNSPKNLPPSSSSVPSLQSSDQRTPATSSSPSGEYRISVTDTRAEKSDISDPALHPSS